MATAEVRTPVRRRILALLFDRENPWRRSFLLLRIAKRNRPTRWFPAFGDAMDSRFRRSFEKSPAATYAYLRYIEDRFGPDSALTAADEISASYSQDAPITVEVAKYFYSRHRFARGDALLEQAKIVDPTLLRIYDEEAWNQRARGNIHREISAVKRCIELAPSDDAQRTWRMWLGEAHLRLHDPAAAWPFLSDFRALPAGDPALFSAAYCARLLGDFSASDEAYARSVAAGPGFDPIAAAAIQLHEFRRSDEVLQLIGPATTLQPTPALELLYTAHLRLGQPDEAMQALELAASRDDRSVWVRSTRAQLLDLIGSASAESAYASLTNHERTPVSSALHARLLATAGDTQKAVRQVLGPGSPRQLSSTQLVSETVDPMAKGLAKQIQETVDPNRRIHLLEELVGRLSGEEALREAARALAVACADAGDWERAWEAARTLHTQRLPAVTFGTHPDELHDFTPSMAYSEWVETEHVRPNTVLYESSLGDTTSCNPLAICLELLADSDRSDLIHVWSVTRRASIHPALRDHPRVRFVEKGSPGHVRLLATARYLINNATWETFFTKRPDQRTLNTWHGVPWKKLGKDQKNEPFSYGNVARSFLQSDLVIAPDPHTLDVLSRGMDIDVLRADTRFVRMGYPRNDLAVSLSPERRMEIRTSLGANGDTGLVLFMPTWQGLMGQRQAEVQSTLEAANALAGEGRVVAVRAHHYVREAFAGESSAPGVRLIPERFDTNELLGAADALVTDFSSVLFDAAAVGLPVIKLTKSLEHYDQERGLYFAAQEVPGQNACSFAELPALIASALHDPESFRSSYAAETLRFSSPESGASSREVIKLFFDELPLKPRPRRPESALYLGASGLPTNGITRSLRSLLASLEPSQFIPFLSLGVNSLESAAPDTLEDIRQYARILPLVGEIAGTQMERQAMSFFLEPTYVDSEFVRQALRSGQKREAKRRFGTASFQSALEFSGYDPLSLLFVAEGVALSSGPRGVLLHNEMWREISTRYPRLRSGMMCLSRFDYIASVSESVRERNANDLFTHFGVPRELHLTLENLIDSSQIRRLSQAPLDNEDAAWYRRTGIHVCVASRLSPEKNHAMFLHALAAEQDASHLLVTLLGEGPLMQELEQLVSRLDLQDRVRLRGLVLNPYPHIASSDVMFLPSLYEGQGLVLLEALTLGTPVVATDIPGPRSVLDSGLLGTLVEPTVQGLRLGLRAICTGDLVAPDAFDAETYESEALSKYLKVLGTGSCQGEAPLSALKE